VVKGRAYNPGVEVKRLDLGVVLSVHAESFGEPGQRTFRVLADAGKGRVSLWLEKQQIVALLAACNELLERVPEEDGREPVDVQPQAFMGDLEVRVGSLSVGYDGQKGGFAIEASDFESDLDLTHIAFMADRDGFAAMRDELDDIVGRSRPRCPLCGTPLSGEPHFCPPSNGHAHLTVES